MGIANAQEQITRTLLAWQGVSAHPHRFGGIEYRLGRRELGHIHGDHLVDILQANALFRRSYDLANEQLARRAAVGEPKE